ncbi:beta-phosphoglucomutase family hydrolase [Amycolatopsis acidiphila]|uniref:Beta-phosphoglucomutase n=1 Tax=Amycolatopsis acidiphila TaxID=715473 RepID=A0A557ZZN6_9PSEU|nr:beta-phosphoglucomutase family hydrolase [Amycolatopsis acidiphila]TVT17466.1 beta-phosphoglucomutase family hydrolase [Amycolatopsis acidiphila]UIJ62180.1 beta-phosphoglucomutase family hydrolase [Amycolatopsis acidiphila]GHG92416.1 hydrolase [Amycolatopsis acidiphila]
MIGLPEGISACLFDLDGVLTGTAALHREAWKQTFDAFLRERDGAGFRPFTDADYAQHVDGRPRADGVRAFLASRSITLPEGDPNDPPNTPTVNGLGNRKNELVLRIIDERGVDPYPGSVRYLEEAQKAGLAIAVVTSSANGAAVLEAAKLSRFVKALVDGLVLKRDHLRGKPAPDSFLAGAKALGVDPSRAAVFEDALAGVQAGRAGNFGYVVGVNRANQADELRAHGADVVVDDLADLLGDKA